MKTLVLATSDEETNERVTRAGAMLAGVSLIVTRARPKDISPTIVSRDIAALCMRPGPIDEWLTVREMLFGKDPSRRMPRIALVVDSVDAAFVYRVLAYGIDDVIDLSADDQTLASGLQTLADGRGRACERYLVSDVMVPPPMARQRIAYSDDLDRRIVAMIAIGYTDLEISRVVSYSHQVIRNRVSRLLLNSGLRNRTHLAARFTLERLEDSGGASAR